MSKKFNYLLRINIRVYVELKKYFADMSNKIRKNHHLNTRNLQLNKTLFNCYIANKTKP